MPTLILSSVVLAEIIPFLFRYLSPRLLCHSIICPPPPRAASLSRSPSLYLFSVSVRRERERASERAEGEKRHKLDQTTSYQICHRTEKFPRVTLSRLCNGPMAAAVAAAAMRAKLTYYSVAGRRARNVLCGLLRRSQCFGYPRCNATEPSAEKQAMSLQD